VRRPRLVLASGSPRRRELLASIGLVPEVVAAEIDERWRGGEAPRRHAARLAREKAAATRRLLATDEVVVLAADTIVVDPDGKVLGKPKDRAEAVRFLLRLGGRTHRVLTAVEVVAPAGRRAAGVATTSVRFRPVSRAAAVAYAATGEPDDKAGAYAIQGIGSLFVAGIRGNFSNVVGLPLPLAVDLLARVGAPLPTLVTEAATR